MTATYFNFAGAEVDSNEAASHIVTELKKTPSVNVPEPTQLDKYTVRAVARVVDSAFSEFLEELEFRLPQTVGSDVELDAERFASIYESICDVVETEVNRTDVEYTDEDEYDEYYDEYEGHLDLDWDEDYNSRY